MSNLKLPETGDTVQYYINVVGHEARIWFANGTNVNLTIFVEGHPVEYLDVIHKTGSSDAAPYWDWV